ncbi:MULTISPECIES: biotin--[acetyl-CoA-carboxylase] ligase [unclassified Polaromonas]|uniref:biotin--[acetyl-CoA-carboxylase] ligase n=1 Tax=unclassified Polaromonas TaxID=2638319 RepID=UPI000F092D45|nr:MULTISPECIES: biotin--[acetyl-CoA-carboxylase] ligase [unclassified Polaromonas]AYQ27871.1 biotin--[acetyl-CoA-carboxylase] ligase [Polaromonas sp. SP1]QGJ17269.1 biotin--[acetyl-CoA-carboxylase] ligase [Polaromonas sp. Pch-P]
MTNLPTNPIRWPAEALWEAVAPSLPGFTVEVLPEIDSTNTELMRRFRGSPTVEPRPEPLLLVAEQQTAGRGRLGRQWQSRRGDSLMFSLGLPLAPVDWSGLSLVAGISVAESLEPRLAGSGAKPRIGLKWPNDLWLSTPEGERKLAGILVETASWEGLRYVVIGIGINIRAVPLDPGLNAALPASALPGVPPGSLQDLLPELDAPAALLRVIPPLVQAVQAFAQFGFAPFQARFAARDVLAGRAVRLSDGTAGTAHGAGENGALLVHTAAGMKEITSSEVSVRPLPDSAAPAPGGTRPC